MECNAGDEMKPDQEIIRCASSQEKATHPTRLGRKSRNHYFLFFNLMSFNHSEWQNEALRDTHTLLD